MKRLNYLLFAVLIGASFLASAQSEKKINFAITEIPEANIAFLGSAQIQANDFKVFQMDVNTLMNELAGIANRESSHQGFVAQIELPHPDGNLYSYKAVANNTMDPALASQFPEIKTFDAHGVDNNGLVKWDITPKGLHAMIFLPGESTIFIDPLIDGNSDYYIVYRKKDFNTSKIMDCSFDSEGGKFKMGKVPVSGIVKSFGTCELRTYRLALSATGEYTVFHGGTVALALAAQATTMNRVNGVFERDMAITMTMIANNNLIIYTNPSTDPFANGTPGTMINQNQTNTDAVIGNGNYDIGHVFGTNSGGLAGLGVVCNNTNKARGVTGSAAPVGDPFDIDYVAHEMGHQFGANHTQNNNCNRNNATAMEPGSASTIMGYAGICAPNVQSNSDDHFHGISLEEIGFEILSAGHTCEQITPLSNNAPIVLGTNGNITVPASTPFALTASVTDPDGDPLLYCWEQMDNQVSTQPPLPTSTGGPNFRSNSPVADSVRYFPNLADLAAGISPTWEVLASVSRTMNFRVTVRDQSLNVPGCNDHEDLTVTVDGGSGPFVVLYPSATGIIWAGLTTETVTWDVANTDLAPVNCATVDILLSTDGGLTYPTVLATGVANDGSETISVPNVATTTARVMVINSNGTFFDISDNNFEITMATFDFSQSMSPNDTSICQPNDAVYQINIGSVGGFNDPVTLSASGVPAGATATFSVNPVTPAGTSVLTISNTASAAPGVYTITVDGTSTTGTKTSNVTLTISDGNPAAVTQITPANLASAVAVPTDFTWTSAPQIGVSYEIDIASDAGFTTIVDNAVALASPAYTSSVLSANTTYYWRVRSVTGCGSSAWSSTYVFTTDACMLFTANDTPVAISASGTPTITSIINIPSNGNINDVNILNLNGTHSWINDLIVTITSPAGTVVTLWDQICNSQDDFDVNFDDAAATGTLPCPPIGGGTYLPDTPLSAFNGEDPQGNWVLTIQDVFNQDGGSLNNWQLQVCLDAAAPCIDPDVPTVSGVNTICENESTTLSISSGNLNDAIDWQWYSGTCAGTAEGNGTSVTVSPTTSTSYFIRGEGGCVTPGVCVQFDVTVNSISNTSENANVCEGGDYTFPDGTVQTNIVSNLSYVSTLSSVLTGCDSLVTTNLSVDPIVSTFESSDVCSGTDYTFPDGTTSTNITADMSYVSTLTSIVTGCDSLVTTDLTVVSSFMINQNAEICEGDVYTFPDGSTGSSAQVQTSILTSTGGCDSTIVTTLTVNTINVNVLNNAPTLTADLFADAYQWLDCDNNYAVIPGETMQSFTATALVGNYAVEITLNGCSDTSACYLIDQSALYELGQGLVLIYPNPTSGMVQISWQKAFQFIEVTDARGRLLTKMNVTDKLSQTFDVSLYSSGVYFVHLIGEEGRTVFELIKQ